MTIENKQTTTPLLTGTRRRALSVAIIILFFDLYEIYQAGALSALAVPHFGGGTAAVTVVTASLFVGSMIGAFGMSKLADRYGRRAGLLTSCGIYTIGALCTGFSPTLSTLVAGRFITGIGVGAVQPMVDAYATDMSRPERRGRAVATVYTIAFLGIPAVGLLAYQAGRIHPLGIPGWRWLIMSSLIGIAVVALLNQWLVESPTWLRARDRTDRGGEAARPDRRQAKGLFSPRWRRATQTLMLLNFFSPFAYYGFGTLAPLLLKFEGYSLLSSLGYSALSYFGYPVGSALTVLFIDRINRKWLIVFGHLAMGAVGALFVSGGTPATVVAGGFMYTLVSNIVANANHVYMAELYPTTLRASGNGASYAVNKAATAIMPLVFIPLLFSAGAGIVFTIVGVGLLAVALCVAFLGPNSADSPLVHESVAER